MRDSVFFILSYQYTKFLLILYVDQFSYYLSIERQLSPNTVASYGAEVTAFLSFLDGKPAVECTSDDVTAYMASRAGELSKRSQAHSLSALKS